MREKLIQYVSKLFEGSYGTEDMRQEILQNTLDRYDDLIREGKTEQDAYDQAVAGIGDIGELLHRPTGTQEVPSPSKTYTPLGKRICTAVAVALYILCPVPLLMLQNAVGLCLLLVTVAAGVTIQVLAEKLIDGQDPFDPLAGPIRPILTACGIALCILCPLPLFLLQSELGLCLLLAMVAAGVAMMIVSGNGNERPPENKEEESPLSKLISLLVVALYLAVSFRTMAWGITWIIFPIAGTVKRLFKPLPYADSTRWKNPVRIILALVILLSLVSTFGSILVVSNFSKFPFPGTFHIGSKFETADAPTVSSSDAQDDLTVLRDFSDVTALKIDWAAGSVHIQAADQDTLSYRISNEDPNRPAVCNIDGSRMTIEYSSRSIPWLGTAHSKDLEILIPRSWAGKELEIDTVSASVTLEGLDLEELDMETTSGRIRVRDLRAQDVSIETISGSVDLTGFLRSLELDTVSGDCTVSLAQDIRKIKTDAVSGSVRLSLPKQQGYEAKLDTVSGSLNTPGAAQVGSKNHRRYGDGSCMISADSVSGSLTIEVQ